MTVTIHYTLWSSMLTRPIDVRELVEALRQFARQLPFAQVGALIELQGQLPGQEPLERAEQVHTLWHQAQAPLPVGAEILAVQPLQTYGFCIWPGAGCPPTALGLSQYPGNIDLPSALAAGRRLLTHLDGWRWRGCCTTCRDDESPQGDVLGLLGRHWALIKLLDFARSTEVVTLAVHDDSGYWSQRSLEELASAMGRWADLVAAVRAGPAATAPGLLAPGARLPWDSGQLEEFAARAQERLQALWDRRQSPGDLQSS